MKKTVFSALILLAGLSLSAQQKEPVIAQAMYHFSHMRDTANPGVFYEENMILRLGKTAGLYESYDKAYRDSVDLAMIDSVRKAGGIIRLSSAGKKPTTATVLYKFIGANKLYSKEFHLKYYFMEDEMPVIDWNISNETKKIMGIDCQKATGVCKGRTYEAWFAPGIPFNNGPWKLQGLPGLIVEASDLKKQVNFKFAGFQPLTASNRSVELPTDIIPTTRAEYTRLVDAINKNPEAFLSGNGNGALISMRGATPGARPAGGGPVNTVNNPVELP
ncbi:GLPGLI family protein [Sediminibacterium ginsengisoli]|nr:GLPGLI family protein [Sediminibacterium ginsengisoli]